MFRMFCNNTTMDHRTSHRKPDCSCSKIPVHLMYSPLSPLSHLVGSLSKMNHIQNYYNIRADIPALVDIHLHKRVRRPLLRLRPSAREAPESAHPGRREGEGAQAAEQVLDLISLNRPSSFNLSRREDICPGEQMAWAAACQRQGSLPVLKSIN